MSATEETSPLFLAPLRLEAFAARRARPCPQVQRIGMGPVAATAAMARLSRMQRPPRPIVLLGFGGALDADLRAGDLVVARTVTGMDSDEKFALPEAPELARRLNDVGLVARLGDVVSVPRILKGDVEREKAAASGAIVCDMESLWLAPLARRCPFVVVRAVVDTVGGEITSLSTPRAAARAFGALARVARVLARWAPNTADNYPLVEAGES